MTNEEAITKRLEELIEAGKLLHLEENAHAESVGWIASALNIVVILFSDVDNIYRKEISNTCFMLDEGRCNIDYAVDVINSVLKNIRSDMKYGLVLSIENKAIAETFDEFLEHGRAYFEENRKMESGVICGVVFEDSIRKLCKKHNIEESGVKLDSLIGSLTKIGVIKGIKGKRARVAADVRTKATHAQWTEFELSDVSETIEITQELISYHLSDK